MLRTVDPNNRSELVHGRFGPNIGYDQHAFDVDQHRLVCVPPGRCMPPRRCGQELVCRSNLSHLLHDQQCSELECGQQLPLPHLGSGHETPTTNLPMMDILSSAVTSTYVIAATLIALQYYFHYIYIGIY